MRLLGTRGEARPAGWSLHRTGMRAGHVRGFTIISLYGATHVCMSVKIYCMLEYPRQLEREWFGGGTRVVQATMRAIAQAFPHTSAPGKAAGGPRRAIVSQAQAA